MPWCRRLNLLLAMSMGSQLTRDARHLHIQFVFVVTEGATIREEFLVAAVTYVLKWASKNRKRQEEEANGSATGGGLLAASWLHSICLVCHFSTSRKIGKKLCTTQLPKNVDHRALAHNSPVQPYHASDDVQLEKLNDLATNFRHSTWRSAHL